MKEQLAVDIALLLPEGTNARCREINAALVRDDPTGFAFDSTHVPHVTLVQQFVLKSNLAALRNEIEQVVKGRFHLQLRALEAVFFGSTTSLRIAKSTELRKLHEDLVRSLAELSEPRGDGHSFFSSGESVRDEDIAWVTEYRKAASFDRYDPHVTLGVGRTDVAVQPFLFTVDRVGLFHLGRFCTCRHRFQEWRLKPA